MGADDSARKPGQVRGMTVRDAPLPERHVIDSVERAQIRALTVDDLSNVRYIHAASMRIQAAQVLSEEELAAFSDHVYSEPYAQALSRTRLVGAVIDTELVGTAGWSLGDDSGSGVRISSLHVRPLFTRMGLGKLLLAAAEADARAAGFDTFSARATHNAISFFEAQGYVVTSHGTYQLGGTRGLPVAFMRKVDPPPGPSRFGSTRQQSPVTIN